jgi:hypothetical protein
MLCIKTGIPCKDAASLSKPMRWDVPAATMIAAVGMSGLNLEIRQDKEKTAVRQRWLIFFPLFGKSIAIRASCVREMLV